MFQLWIVLNSCAFMLLYFISFLRLGHSVFASVLLCVAVAAGSMALEILRIFFMYDDALAKLVVTCLNIVLLQGASLLLSEKRDAYALFIGFSSSIFALAGSIASCGVLVLQKNVPLAMAVCTAVNAALFCFLFRAIRTICIHMLSKEISVWMCVFPAMSYVTFWLILYFPISFERRPENLVAAFSFLMTIVALYVLLIHYIYVKSGEKELQWKNNALSAYIQGVEIQSAAAGSAMRDFYRMRHDMRHKDRLLIGLLQEKKYRDAKCVLEKDMEYLDQTTVGAFCDHAILDSILRGMAKKAEQMDIALRISCAVPGKTEIDDYDLAMLSANLIENALQAAEQSEGDMRAVTLVIKNMEGGAFFFEIRNPCKEEVHISKKTGLPSSRRGPGHGYGMASVRRIVEKYQAHFDCCMEGKEFVVRILARPS